MHFVLDDKLNEMARVQKNSGDSNSRVIMPFALVKFPIAVIIKRTKECLGIHYCNKLVEVILVILHQNSVYDKLDQKISSKQCNILFITKIINILIIFLGFSLIS